MTEFKNREVCYTTTEGGRYSKELAEEVQFYHDVALWAEENPIDRELEIPPSPVRIARWIQLHRKTLSMIIGRMGDAVPLSLD